MIELCIVPLIITIVDAASVLYKGDPFTVEPCNEEATIENDCNNCVCSDSHVYECSSKNTTACKDDIENVSTCHANVIYVLNETICICNKTAQWPHEQCKKVFNSLQPPELQTDCEPNTYVKKDCNVCRCESDGKVNNSRCTKNICGKKAKNYLIKSRRISNVYGNCEVTNWYSLAPCQFCFCVNENKLVCNTGNTNSHKLELGAYHLSVCGKELIREAIQLVPENQKALRYGIVNKVESTTAKNIALQINDISIDVNREGNHLKDVKNQNDNDEYYTDSEEKPVQNIGREASISIPFNNESPNERKEYDQDIETDNEMGVEIEAPKAENVVKEMEVNVQGPAPQQLPGKKYITKLTENFNLGEALKLNLPMVLDKVFQMALRKSMVSVDSESKCITGAATILKCNVCFCMKENKLLCTNNVCENK